MKEIFSELLYRPLFNLLIFLYNVIPGHDFGVAIIAMTVLIRLLFSPLSVRTQRAQKAMSALNPKIQELKERHKDDPAAHSAAVLQLYKLHNVNPLSGCLPLLIQLPILIALYQAFLAGFKPESLGMLYAFVQNPGTINPTAFGILNITIKNSFLAVIAGVLQFLQAKFSANISSSGNPTQNAMMAQMMYFFPVMVIFITWKLPAGLAIYWITSTLFSLGEQAFIKYRYGK